MAKPIRYRILGSSGLRVFPLSLGTGHFGRNELFDQMLAIGQDEEQSEKIFLRYIQEGGNFIDTANFYHIGQSETLIGKFIKKNKIDREKLVVATKYSFLMNDDPNSGGNHKKSLFRSVNDSLARLQMEYVDILYVHFWDWSVDPEDLMRMYDELIRTGKVLHIAASDLPASIVAEANTVSRYRGWNPFIAYQGKFSLVDRSLDQEIFPMCKRFNMGTIPWAALGQGKLTGRKSRNNVDQKPKKDERSGLDMTETDFKIQDEVIRIANEIGKTPSQVALNWAMHKTTSPLLGPRTLDQLEDNLGALKFDLTEQQLKRLDEVSKDSPNVIFPNYWNGTNVENCQFLYMGKKNFTITKF